MHDAHSDGSCLSQYGQKVPCPLYKTVQSAAQRGLDFIAISDHNTASHYDAMRISVQHAGRDQKFWVWKRRQKTLVPSECPIDERLPSDSRIYLNF